MKHLFFMLVSIFFVVGTSANANELCENDFAKLDADFEGARMSSCEAKNKHFVIQIDPENKPINPSPWYAFRVTPKQSGDLKIIMRYSDAKHRYQTKISDDAKHWRLLDESRIKERRKGKKVTLKLELKDDPFLVAGQELLLAEAYDHWITATAKNRDLTIKTVGKSVEGRSLIGLFSSPISEAPEKEYVLFVGRQHPPEVTGGLAMLPFLETVFADTELAIKFRERYHIIAVPLMNPDGVARGHWRHNVNGIDLNRDWGPFTQPETQSIERLLDEIYEDKSKNLRLMFDFHSTNRNVFYTQTQDTETNPPQFTEKWLAGAQERLGEYQFERAERHQSELATSKNYIFGRFGAPGITYELGDHTDRRLIKASAIIFAEEMMETLLSYDELEQAQPAAAGE